MEKGKRKERKKKKGREKEVKFFFFLSFCVVRKPANKFISFGFLYSLVLLCYNFLESKRT